jgi:hypothetical protein
MDIIREAGPPIWFVLVFGAYAIVQAVRYRRGSEGPGEVIGAVVATFLAGVLGTAWGAQMAFGGLRELPDPAQQHWIAFVGIKEALYNLDVACAACIAAALVATVARRRPLVTAQPGDAVAPDA